MDLLNGSILEPSEAYAGSLLPPASTQFKNDEQQKRWAVPEDFGFTIPNSENLLTSMPTGEDQYHRGTCATFAASLAAAFRIGKDLSEQHLYNRAWSRDQQTRLDPSVEATSLPAVLDTLKVEGTCEVQYWHYEPLRDDRNLPQNPVPDQAQTAEKYKIDRWHQTRLPVEKKGEAIAQLVHYYGSPVILGVEVIWNLCGWEFGLFIDLPPEQTPRPTYGSHAIVCSGYNLSDRYLIVQNSWGTDWGVGGVGLISFEYLEKYLFDAFVIGV